MRSNQRRSAALAAAVLAAAVLPGCGPGGPKTYSVNGKVELAGGEVKHLAGGHVEAALASDPGVRASGVIQADGSFSLETRHAGVVRKGAQEGNYQVRILPSDEDRAIEHLQRSALAPRFLRFETSGLSFQVPSDGNVTLTVSQQ